MNVMYNSDGSTEPDPQSLGIVPASDPFWGDPEYPQKLRLNGHDGITLHVVVISNVGPHHLVWNCTEQRLLRLTLGEQATPKDPPRKCTMCGGPIWKLLADTADVCGTCQYQQMLEEYDDVLTPDIDLCDVCGASNWDGDGHCVSCEEYEDRIDDGPHPADRVCDVCGSSAWGGHGECLFCKAKGDSDA